ncbi:hypothetical protein [Runella sp.]|uniref:hypothetical protein n=1 Tax=Runella sp. TaxID=1960881 RepID=UPI0030161F29
MSNYNLIWAVAILRDDFGHTWAYIGETLNITDKKAKYLYDKRKKHYSIDLGATAPSGTGTAQNVTNFDRDIGAHTVSRKRHPFKG